MIFFQDVYYCYHTVLFVFTQVSSKSFMRIIKLQLCFILFFLILLTQHIKTGSYDYSLLTWGDCVMRKRERFSVPYGDREHLFEIDDDGFVVLQGIHDREGHDYRDQAN